MTNDQLEWLPLSTPSQPKETQRKITCPHCGKTTLVAAAVCPHCGRQGCSSGVTAGKDPVLMLKEFDKHCAEWYNKVYRSTGT